MKPSKTIVPIATKAQMPSFAAPAVVPLKPVGQSGGVIAVTATGTAGQRIGLFTYDGKRWNFQGLGPLWELKQPAEKLGIAAVPATVPAPAADTFTLQIATEDRSFSAMVSCQIAPVLLASALDPVVEVFVIRNKLTARFTEELARLLPRCDGKPKLRFLDYDAHPSDIWMQDTVEIGIVPTVDGRGRAQQTPFALLGLRGKHDMGLTCGPLDLFVAEYLAREFPQMGQMTVGEPRAGARWIDWFGNLEVTPPLPGYPFGRVLTGDQKGLRLHPQVLSFLEAQRIQWPPLVLDLSWLTIGHIDEMINFVPARNQAGFRVLLPSPARTRAVLETAVRAGQGKTAVFAGRKHETTVARLLEEVALSEETRTIEASLKETTAYIRAELRISDADIVEMPALFKDGLAVIPNAVNSLIIGQDILIPDPAGPILDGEDIFRRLIREQLSPGKSSGFAGNGLRLHFLDIYEPYHIRSGEIHCGTNTIRRLKNPEWWKNGRI